MDYLIHYGMPRRSGRYPYGSGENPRAERRYIKGLKKLNSLDKKATKYKYKSSKAERKAIKNKRRSKLGSLFFDEDEAYERSIEYKDKASKYRNRQIRSETRATKLANKLIRKYSDIRLESVPPQYLSLGKKYYMEILTT